MRSIRRYLLTRLLTGTACLLSVAGLILFLLVTRALEAQFDRNLEDRIRGLASILFQQEDHVEFEFSEQLMPEYEAGDAPAYFQLHFEEGGLLETSPSLTGATFDPPELPGFEAILWTAPLPDGREGRYGAQLVEVHHVYPEEGPERPEAKRVVIMIARGREDLVAAEHRVLALGSVFVLTLLTLIAVLTWIAINRGLRPARRLADMLDGLQMESLPERVDAGPLPAELVPIARRTDALVRRVDAALRRERRTAADIAHELRTPISELVTVSEVCLRNGHSDGESTNGDISDERRALTTVRDVAWRMGRSVATLLKLARLEMGHEAFEERTVFLGAIVDETLQTLERLENERDLTVQNLVSPEWVVEGDDEVLRIIVSNLLANAMTYAVHGSRVECRSISDEAGWHLVVENDTDDLEPEDLLVLEEPFWRKDGARADRNKSGLGLALSGALAGAVGLELGFELDGKTFRASLGQAEISV